MITNVLLAHHWISPTALIVLVLLGPPLGAWLARRPRLAEVLALVALVPVGIVTLAPVRRELYWRCEVAWTFPSIDRAELAANVVLFVAPILLATVALRRPLLAFASGSTLSAAIEAFQALVPALGRSCSTNDWMTNTMGAALGAVLGGLALLLARRRRDRPSTPEDHFIQCG
ncbi:VanZ family protein [Nocardioides sp.]|uniref:VanZ family protein n=1 Tax=Nocardioides sp. TaxID=35761 RepID=UPI00262E5E9C|nr:VanZ family protein [Nocardioides sp.]